MSRAALLRWSLWLSLLVGLSGLILFDDKAPAATTISQPVVRTSDRAPRPDAVSQRGEATVALPAVLPRKELIRARHAAVGDPFALRNWTPPPPPVVPVQPPAPTAPPLPYTYVGKKQEAGTWEVYLSRGERTLIVREGSSLEGTYVVERIAPPTLSLKYQPLGQVQTLSIGEP